MEHQWVRGGAIGKGSFGTVNLAIPKAKSSEIPAFMVVKSSPITNSNSLENEREILSQLQDCPQITQCYGDDITLENGVQFYNLFLEYATKGSLADQLKRRQSNINGGQKFTDFEVRRYTESILKGLSQIHDKGFVHCDIKLQNILLFDNGVAKIADFGLAKRAAATNDPQEHVKLRGTPLYMSPEVVNGEETESPADIWALGCSVIEMITGKSGWNCSPECDVTALFYRIVIGGEVPAIPGSLCEQGKDFLRKCFIKDPSQRFTARMLLDHPFISGSEFKETQTEASDYPRCCCGVDDNDDRDQQPTISPRCPFDFSDSVSTVSTDFNHSPIPTFWSSDLESELDAWEKGAMMQSFSSRIRELATESVPDWSDSNGWVTVR